MTLKDLVKILLIVLIGVGLFSIGFTFYETVIKNNFQIVEVEE